MRITVLGSGTSHGIPMIGCTCPVCTSEDPRNRRLRTSCVVALGDATILADTTPEMRLQAVREGISAVDAVFFTHAHADHIMGFDDLRRFAELARRPVRVYASPATLGRLQTAFSYALTDVGYETYGIPIVAWHTWTEPVRIAGHRITPVPLEHGTDLATGIRVDSPAGGSLAWCPDCCGIPDTSVPRLRGLDALFLDGLRHRPHPTHYTVSEAVETVRRLAPRRAWLIHLNHDLDHAATESILPDPVRVAFDGMTLDLP